MSGNYVECLRCHSTDKHHEPWCDVTGRRAPVSTPEYEVIQDANGDEMERGTGLREAAQAIADKVPRTPYFGAEWDAFDAALAARDAEYEECPLPHPEDGRTHYHKRGDDRLYSSARQAMPACQDDPRCYRNDGHDGPHAYPSGSGPETP